MQITREFGESFPYSLHDARIQKIEYIDKKLVLHFDYIFSYTNNNTENTHKAKVIFEKIDIDFLDFILYKKTPQGTISGEIIELSEYQNKYKNSEFEVLIESYNWGKAVLQGWIWKDSEHIDCIMNISYFEKMIYEIED